MTDDIDNDPLFWRGVFPLKLGHILFDQEITIDVKKLPDWKPCIVIECYPLDYDDETPIPLSDRQPDRSSVLESRSFLTIDQVEKDESRQTRLLATKKRQLAARSFCVECR